MGKTYFRFVLVSILFLGVHDVRGSQSPGCAFEGLHFDECLNQGGPYVFLEPCCTVMNQAVRAGFHCLCSMLTTHAPQFNLFSSSLTRCYIAIPSLTMCQDLATMPVALPVPPGSPPKEQQIQPSGKENQVRPFSPPLPRSVDAAFKSVSKGNTTVSANENSPRGKNVTQMLHVIKNGNAVSSSGELTNLLWCQSLFVSLTVYSLVLSA